MKYYGEEYAAMPRLKKGNEHIETLDDLYEILRRNANTQSRYELLIRNISQYLRSIN